MGSFLWQLKYRLRRNPRWLLPLGALLLIGLVVSRLWLGGGDEAVTSSTGPVPLEAAQEESDSGFGLLAVILWLGVGIMIGWWGGSRQRKPTRPPYRGSKRWKRERFVR